MGINENYWPDGFGESSGDSLVTTGPWYTDGIVTYVSSVIGDNSNTGLERLQPKETLANAISTVADDNGIIVLAADHSETFTSALTIDVDGLVIVGAGTSGGQPTAQLLNNSAAASMFLISGVRTELRNLLFPPNVQANSVHRVSLGDGANASTDALVKGCRFESGITDNGAALTVFLGSGMKFEDCTFVVTSAAAAGGAGIIVQDTTVANLIVEDCIFDGGTGGFSGGVAFDGSLSTMTDCRFENVSLLRGADVSLLAASDGRVNPVTTTGGARVVFS